MLIKDTLMKKVNSGSRIEADVLFDLIQDFDYVSFDIFDTLVKRNVAEPADVFSIMELFVSAGFKTKRLEAEKRARAESGKKEITLEDIYTYFPLADRDRLIRLELNTELKAIVPNQAIEEVYRRCLGAGKTIYITSDIYWPETAIKKLLKKNGYGSYKKIFISSKQQKVKSDGSLFKHLLETEKIPPDRLIHIGDSIKGDYKEPKKLGIQAIRIPRYFKNIEFRGDDNKNKIEINYLNQFINNTFIYTADPYYQFGYSQFGKLLYGYVHWLHEEITKRNIDKIFFFARDGFIMKQAYETCIKDVSVETRYLEVSRRSLRVPILWMECDYNTILSTVINAKLISLESIFDDLGLEIKNYLEIIEEHNLACDEVFDRSNIRRDDRLKKLIEEIKPDIIENSQKEYKILIRYLEENAVRGKFAVVDIGYGGSMQRYLQQVLSRLEIEHDITGFYFAVADFYTKNMLPGMRLDLNGYLFDFQHDKNAIDTRSSFVGLFEMLFLEQRGSVKKYIKTGDLVSAERYPYEYEENGVPTKDLLKIQNIQRGAIDFIFRAAKDELLELLECKPAEYYEGLYLLGTDPSLEELKLFGSISFYDEGKTEKLANPNSLGFYALHPKQMKNDFLRCRWKTGFLKKLLRIKLPYLLIYRVLKATGDKNGREIYQQ